MTDILQHPYLQAFARALVHFVWQGAAIGIVGYVLLRSLRLSANARHATGVALLAVMLAAPAATTWYFVREAPASGVPNIALEFASKDSPTDGTHTVSAPQAPASASSAAFSSSAAPLVNPMVVLVMWLAGVIVLSIRLVGGWFVARRLTRRAIQLAAPEVQSLARLVAGRLALDRVVRIVESSTISVPVMVGWIKPVVILPTAALAGLTPLQVEALLAHELAHIRRHDYLVNLLQSAVETVLFYHPAVWWVSGEVRAAREQCCDDLAVGICDRLVYATALAELAAMAKTPRLALAAADGSLAGRVRRILGHSASASDARVGWIPAALLALLIAGVAPAVWTTAARAADDQSSVQGGIASRVQGGVMMGVPGGVAGGAPDGAVSGVVGGVAGGVDGGVAGGVTGGVASGVEGLGSPVAVQEQSATDAPTKQLTEQQFADLKAQLDQAKRQLARNRELLANNLVSSDAVAKAEMDVTALQGLLEQLSTPDIESVRRKLQEAEKNLQRFRELHAKGLNSADEAERWKQEAAPLIEEYGRLQAQYSKMLSEKEAVKKAADRNASKAVADQAAVEKAQADPTFQLTFQFLQGQLEEARRRIEVATEQVAKGLAPQSDLDTLRALAKNLELKLQAAEAEQKRMAALEKGAAKDDVALVAYQTQLARLNMEAAQLKLERAKKMADEGVVSQQAVQEAELALKKAQLAQIAMSQEPTYAKLEAVFLSAPAAALRDRIMRDGASMSDDALIGVLKDASKLTGDTDRAEVLLVFARQQTMTPEMATLFVAAGGGIKSDDERARVFRQPVRLRQGKGK